MEPLVLGLGVPELLIILAVVLLLFGGARLAGIGKSTGRAIKEFKEETKGLKEADRSESSPPPPSVTSDTTYQQPPTGSTTYQQPPTGSTTYQQPPTGSTTDPAGSDPRRDS